MQARATITQVNPVSGTQYEVLPVTKNCRIIMAGSQCTWTGQPTPLQIWFIVDAVTIEGYKFNPATATNYYANSSYWDETSDRLALDAVSLTTSSPFILEGKSIQVLAEITGGTVSELKAWVRYAKW